MDLFQPQMARLQRAEHHPPTLSTKIACNIPVRAHSNASLEVEAKEIKDGVKESPTSTPKTPPAESYRAPFDRKR